MGRNVFHIQILFEIMDMHLHVTKPNRLFFSFAPTRWFKSAQYKIFTADDFWFVFLEGQCQHAFQLIAMGDQNIALGTIPAMFVDRRRIGWLNMDEQGHFAHKCFPRTVWAGGKSDILIRIQDEPILWCQFSKSRQGWFLFSHLLQEAAWFIRQVRQWKSQDIFCQGIGMWSGVNYQ